MAPADDYVLVQGIRDTRGALSRWQADPVPIVGRWFVLSFAIAVGLVLAVWAVAAVQTPDPTLVYLPGLHGDPTPGDFAEVLGRNSLVLALHAMACVAGFIAGSSMRLEAGRRTGLSRTIHEQAGRVAIAWVVGVTAFSLITQAYVLGSAGANLAEGVGIEPALLIVTVLPHALPELVALFLPLAAWLVASHREEWDQLLAATVVTVVVAIPILLVSAAVELLVWPELLRLASPLA